VQKVYICDLIARENSERKHQKSFETSNRRHQPPPKQKQNNNHLCNIPKHSRSNKTLPEQQNPPKTQ
jgi:hypothetical protein